MKVLVSIIMPCYNGEKYLPDAIQSVINQTFPDWELIIVDDHSTDNSITIIEEFCKKESRIRFFHTAKSTGLPATPRNLGIQEARGRYIAFLDCDDMWLPTKLERQIPLFVVKNVAIVFSFYSKMDNVGNYKINSIASPVFVSYDYMLNGNCIGNLTAVYDTKKCGKVFQKEIHHEDYVMWLSILQKGFYALNTNTVEAIYRENKFSVSGSKLKIFKWQWNILRNELKIPLLHTVKYFFRYAMRGFIKFIK